MKLTDATTAKKWTVEYKADGQGYPWHIDTMDRYLMRHHKFARDGREDQWLLLAIADTRAEAGSIAKELERHYTPGIAALNDKGIGYMDAKLNQMELHSAS